MRYVVVIPSGCCTRSMDDATRDPRRALVRTFQPSSLYKQCQEMFGAA